MNSKTWFKGINLLKKKKKDMKQPNSEKNTS